ncbi:Dehydrogenase/reductase SDR family member 4 [Hondaea fermentalgiana]|uniref:Dehydrogenase/reductase SDR family member 4 n=1 Tax=Hondaea fermentalgiana TaxID=2315210 RepID=A0A2R5GU40_9STRA|nr:Dehydrogenase/reductase SDR family member 4 [Hondaea fermentalgiana]|eukprot:GBG34382.1 Dehydrogenase/reductase SDR family member 4 [Hondaea fermentalgiana]
MSKGTALVVGASRGIGRGLATRLKNDGYKVIATVREAPSGEPLSAFDKVIEGVDVTDTQACRDALRAGLADVDQIDLLVYNAGIAVLVDNFATEPVADVDIDGVARQMDVNAIGALRVLQAVDDKLKRGAKVLFLSTILASLQTDFKGTMHGYRASKAALNMLGKNISFEYGKRGIAVTLAHPGLVKTDMTNYMDGAISVDDSVSGLVRVIERMSLSEVASSDDPSTTKSYHGALVDATTGDLIPW